MRNYQAFDDDELIALLKVDDEKALAELYDRYWDKLLAIAIHRLANLEAAQEVVQDIFIKLWLRRQELILTATLTTYLAVAVKYSVIDQLDKAYHKRVHTELRDHDLTAQFPSIEEVIFEQELSERIEKNVKALPDKCQLIFRMSRELDFTYKQIASELNISEKTVEAHMSRALRQLRLHLKLCIGAAISFLFL